MLAENMSKMGGDVKNVKIFRPYTWEILAFPFMCYQTKTIMKLDYSIIEINTSSINNCMYKLGKNCLNSPQNVVDDPLFVRFQRLHLIQTHSVEYLGIYSPRNDVNLPPPSLPHFQKPKIGEESSSPISGFEIIESRWINREILAKIDHSQFSIHDSRFSILDFLFSIHYSLINQLPDQPLTFTYSNGVWQGCPFATNIAACFGR